MMLHKGLFTISMSMIEVLHEGTICFRVLIGQALHSVINFTRTKTSRLTRRQNGAIAEVVGPG